MHISSSPDLEHHQVFLTMPIVTWVARRLCAGAYEYRAPVTSTACSPYQKNPLRIAQILPLASSTHRFLLVPASTLDNIADRSILKWLTMSTAEAFGIEHLGNLRWCMIRHQLLNTVLNRGWRPRRPRPDQGAIDGQCRMGTSVPLHIQMNFALLPDPIEMHAFD